MQPILDRFPRLAQLHDRVVHRIPFVQQLEWSDCGAASLAMVLGFHGKHVALDRVRAALAVARDGVTARAVTPSRDTASAARTRSSATCLPW